MAFEKATRAGTKALIGLYGGSGGGKTLSALRMARGLVGPQGKIFLIDTESGRGALYSDDAPTGGYLIDQLEAPYSSARYVEKMQDAINEVKNSGVEGCVIIDSFSHEWEGVGGVVNAAETISENRAKKKGFDWNGSVQFGDWKTPKADHKRMMLQILGAPVHIICCLRAQYKSHQIEKKDYAKYGINSNMKTTVLRDEFQSPIQDANFIFEMMLHLELRANTPNDPNRAGVPIVTKCPEALRHAFPEGQQIGVQTGEAIAKWCQGGGVETINDEEVLESARAAAEKGPKAYLNFFTDLPKESKLMLTSKEIPHPSGMHNDIAHDIFKEISKAKGDPEEEDQ